jgi:YcxB-like protein
MVDISFKYTEADFREFSHNYLMKGRGRRLLWYIALAVAIFALLSYRELSNPMSLLGLLAAFALFIGLWWWILQRSIATSFKMNPQILEQRRFTTHNTGFALKGESFSSDYDWQPGYKIMETPNTYIIGLTPMTGIILPKRAFSTEQRTAFEQWRQLLTC